MTCILTLLSFWVAQVHLGHAWHRIPEALLRLMLESPRLEPSTVKRRIVSLYLTASSLIGRQNHVYATARHTRIDSVVVCMTVFNARNILLPLNGTARRSCEPASPLSRALCRSHSLYRLLRTCANRLASRSSRSASRAADLSFLRQVTETPAVRVPCCIRQAALSSQADTVMYSPVDNNMVIESSKA